MNGPKTITIPLAALFIASTVWFRRFRDGFLGRWWVVAFGLATVIWFSLALWPPGFFRTHDFTHVARLVEMRLALDAGHWPVHWSLNLGYGYGMPLFLFYGPLPFYIASIFTYIGLSFINAIKLVAFGSGVLAFGGMYRAARPAGRAAALVSATLYLAAPYRAVDLYIRGALNEVWAIGLLPWIVASGQDIHHHPRRGALATAAWVAALIFTHNITALIALPFLYIWTVVHLWLHGHQRCRNWLYLTGAYVGGGVLSLGYSLPAMVEKSATNIASILSGYFDYHHHFLYIRQLLWEKWAYGGSEPGPNDGMSFHLGTVALGLVGVVGLQLLWALRQSWRSRHRPPGIKQSGLRQFWSATQWQMFLGGLLLAIALGLTLFHAQPIWEAVPILTFVQFPWRFLAVANVFLALIGGLSLTAVRPTLTRTWVASCLVLLLWPLARFHQPESYLTDPTEYYYTDPGTIRRNMSSILPDYIPAGFDTKLPPVAPPDRLQLITANNNQPGYIEINEPHRLLWLGTAPADTTIIWNIAHFPGWKYYVNDQAVTPTLDEHGRMQFITTEPVHSSGAVFTLTPIRRYSLAISALAWLIWLTLAWLPANQRGFHPVSSSVLSSLTKITTTRKHAHHPTKN